MATIEQYQKEFRTYHDRDLEGIKWSIDELFLHKIIREEFSGVGLKIVRELARQEIETRQRKKLEAENGINTEEKTAQQLIDEV